MADNKNNDAPKDPSDVNPFGDGPKLTGADIDRVAAARKAQGSAQHDDDPSGVNPFGTGRRKTAIEIEADIAAKKQAIASKDGMGPPMPKALSDHTRKKTLDDMAQLEKIIAMAQKEKLQQGQTVPEFQRVASKKTAEDVHAMELAMEHGHSARAKESGKAGAPSYVSDHKSHGSVSEIDERREKARRTRLLMKTLEIRDWLYGLLNKDVATEQKSKGPAGQAADFMTSLEDGIMLCRLIKVISPSENIHVEEGPKANPFYKRDNVANFLKACANLGVAPQSMFVTDDLVSRKNDDMVVSALMMLARAAMKHGVAPPLIIQYELDIDEENNEDDNNGAPIIMVEDAQADETEEEKGKREQIEKLSIQIKELEVDIKADEEAGGDEESDVASGTASPPPTGSAIVSEAEQKQRDAKQKAKQSARTRREKAKAKHAQLQEVQALEKQMSRVGENYKAVKGDSIDEAVGRAVNDPDNKFYAQIRVRRARKLGKAATAKRSKREKEGGGIYRVGSAHKVHVRLVQEMLFVRQGTSWVDFTTFVHEQIEADKKAHDRVHAEDPKMVWVPKGATSPPHS